ncbi:MAG: hypothetical protein JXA00_02660 [Candidatus Thermoplasmatota archaeon]|nr:hypothetical protein [Candidatus Thermoplasmatota archaeon]
MQKTGYERYGLSSNPFRDLSSESLENVDIFHVVQRVDEDLARMREEVFYKENKAVVAVLGGLGAGKTERLLLVANEAKRNNAFYVFQNMTFETRWVVEGILHLLLLQSHLGFFTRLFSAPKWYKSVKKKLKKAEKQYDPDKAGRIIADALNNNAPSFLLINDFHHLARVEDAERFLHTLHVMIDHIDQGVMIMISSDQQYFESLMEQHKSLHERINRKIQIPPLSDEEAQLMIAKRLLEKRLVDDVDPLYPFTPEGVAFLNLDVAGNPRHLLKLADVVIDYAAKKRSIMIDEVVVGEVLSMVKEQKITIPEDAVAPELVCVPIQKITTTASSEPSSNTQKTTMSHKKTSSQKTKAPRASPRKSSAVRNTKDAQVTSIRLPSPAVEVSCPMCQKTFTTTLNDTEGILRCPYCDFLGAITE